MPRCWTGCRRCRRTTWVRPVAVGGACWVLGCAGGSQPHGELCGHGALLGARAGGAPEPAGPLQQRWRCPTPPHAALASRRLPASVPPAGLTLWSISKTHRVPQEGCEALYGALQAEITRRLATVPHSQYLSGALGGLAWAGLAGWLVGRPLQDSGQASSELLDGWQRHHTQTRATTPRCPPSTRAAHADKHYSFGAQSLSNIVYSAAAMGLRPDYDLLHAVGRAVAWEIAEFKPQVGAAAPSKGARCCVVLEAGKSGVRQPPGPCHRWAPGAWAGGSLAVPRTRRTERVACCCRLHATRAAAPAHMHPYAPGAPTCPPQGLANILWGLGKLGVKVTHEVRQMVEALTDEMLEQLTRARHKGAHKGAVQGCSTRAPACCCCLGGACACGSAALPCCHRRRLAREAGAIAGRHLTCSASSVLPHTRPATPLLAGTFAPQNISNTLHGLVNIGIAPSVRLPLRRPPPLLSRAPGSPALPPLRCRRSPAAAPPCLVVPPLASPPARPAHRPKRPADQ